MTARELEPCGTNAAYQRHRRHGEVTCQECRDAVAANERDFNARTGAKRARYRAFSELARRHRGEFAQLLAQERARAQQEMECEHAEQEQAAGGES